MAAEPETKLKILKGDKQSKQFIFLLTEIVLLDVNLKITPDAKAKKSASNKKQEKASVSKEKIKVVKDKVILTPTKPSPLKKKTSKA